MRLFFGAVVLLLSVSTNADFQGKVVSVSDGDTVNVLDKNNKLYKVRLAWIDAPEMGQDFGRKSKENLSKMIFNKMVFVQSSERDQYGRDLGVIYLNGVNVNKSQVQSGMAWAYKYYIDKSKNAELKDYLILQDLAKKQKKGLWSGSSPVEPYLFRRQNKNF